MAAPPRNFAEHSTRHAQPTFANKLFSFFRLPSLHFKAVVVFAGTAAIMAVLVLGAWQNVSAQKDINQAQNLDKEGKYQVASELLRKTNAPLLIPTVRQNASVESKNNQVWLNLQTQQRAAELLMKAGKYSEALVILQKIPKNYPTYAAITRDISQTQIAIDTARQQAAQAAAVAIDQQHAAQAAATKQRQSAQPPAQLSCTPSTPLKGKRSVSTTAYNAVLGATNVSQVAQIIQTFFNQYNVHVEVATVTPSSAASKVVTYALVADSDLCAFKVYGATLIDEWSKYPVDWVVSTKLKDIMLVTTLQVSGQTRAAMPDLGGMDMYYDVRYSGDYAREGIHHEFDHLLTGSFFGTYWPNDPTWQSFNPAGFTYGNGGTSCYIHPGSCPSTLHPIPGFVDFYATTDIAEDKAELYAYLMTDTYHHDLNNWVTTDANLKNKVNNYKQFIASHSPEMSGSYFEDINP